MIPPRNSPEKICQNGAKSSLKNSMCFESPGTPYTRAISGVSLGDDSDKESSHVVGKFQHSGAS